jgi:hypothetical protein
VAVEYAHAGDRFQPDGLLGRQFVVDGDSVGAGFLDQCGEFLDLLPAGSSTAPLHEAGTPAPTGGYGRRASTYLTPLATDSRMRSVDHSSVPW